MAPTVSVADDVAQLSQVVSQLARSAWAGRSLSQLEQAAAAAGTSAEQARAFLRGEITLPPRQGIAFCHAILEQTRMQQVSYMATLRQGHAGADWQRGSYQAKVLERVALPRGRTEDRVWARGGPVEATGDDGASPLARLRKDWPSWRVEAGGREDGG